MSFINYSCEKMYNVANSKRRTLIPSWIWCCSYAQPNTFYVIFMQNAVLFACWHHCSQWCYMVRQIFMCCIHVSAIV